MYFHALTFTANIRSVIDCIKQAEKTQWDQLYEPQFHCHSNHSCISDFKTFKSLTPDLKTLLSFPCQSYFSRAGFLPSALI